MDTRKQNDSILDNQEIITPFQEFRNIPKREEGSSLLPESPFLQATTLNNEDWNTEADELYDEITGSDEMEYDEAEDMEDHEDDEYEDYTTAEYIDEAEDAAFESDRNAETEEEEETIPDYEEWEEDWKETERMAQDELEYEYDETYNDAEVEQETPPVSNSIFTAWYNMAAKDKDFFPEEPQRNLDQLVIPSWIVAEDLYQEFTHKYDQDATTIIGDRTKAVKAKYFVIHDTAVAAEFSAARVKGKGIHLWMNARTPVVLSLDWHQSGLGVKLERKRNNSFVHIELTRDAALTKAVERKTGKKKVSYDEIMAGGGIKQFGTYYTDKQYELLAWAYMVTSLRRGKFLTVTIHREVDRSVVVKRKDGQYGYGHDDPQFFDLDYFYSIVARLLGMPSGVTFGIQTKRALAHKQGNMAGFVNAFIPFVTGDAKAANQYGELVRLDPKSVKYKLVKLKGGYYYTANGLKNKLIQSELSENADYESSFMYDLPTPEPVQAPPFLQANEPSSPPGYSCYVQIDLGQGNYRLNVTGIFFPPSFNPLQPVDIILYLHGMTGAFPGATARMDKYWSAVQLPKYDLRLREEVTDSGKNVVLVAPSLGNSPNAYVNTLSGKKGGLDAYMEKVMAAVNEVIRKKYNAGPISAARLILSAHSAGGSQMRKIATLENPVYGPKITECWGFDSLYGGVGIWLTWAKANPGKKLFIYYLESTQNNAVYLCRLAKKLTNVLVYHSTAKNHYWVPKHHLKNRLQNIGISVAKPTCGEALPKPTTAHELYELESGWSNAVRLNRHYGTELGWQQHYDRINELLLPYAGLSNVSLSEEMFAFAVSNWQKQHGFTGKQADGVIGPGTWALMSRQLNGAVTKLPAPAVKKTKHPGAQIIDGVEFKPVKKGWDAAGGGKIKPKLEDLAQRGLLSITPNEIEMLRRISIPEADQFVNSVNSYDSAYMSMGFIQFTLKYHEIQELIKMAPDAFKKHGIELDYPRKYILKDEQPLAIKNAPNIDDLRSLDWAVRFYRAGLEDAVIIAQVNLARRTLNGVRKRTDKNNYLNRFNDAWPALWAFIYEAHNSRRAPLITALTSAIVKATAANVYDAAPFTRMLIDELNTATVNYYSSEKRGYKSEQQKKDTIKEELAKVGRIIEKIGVR